VRRLGLLSGDEAVRLLGCAVGEESVRQEMAAARRLANLCGRIPLALRLAAAQLTNRRRQTIRGLVARLDAERERLALLSVEGGRRSLWSTLASSYRGLPPATGRLFRLLGGFPGPTFTVPAAAALSGAEAAAAAGSVGELTEAHLVEQINDDRYRMHDLVRLFARECGRVEETEAARGESMRRLADWYLACAAAVNATLTPRRVRAVPRPSFPRPDLPVPDSHDRALSWPDEERANLVAFVRYAGDHGPSDAGWQVPYLLWGYFAHHGQWADCVDMHRAAVVAAGRGADPEIEAFTRGNLALALVYIRELDEGLAEQRRSLRFWRKLGHLEHQAISLGSIAFVHDCRQEYEHSAEALRQSVSLAEQSGDRVQAAMGLINLGQTTAKLGDTRAALDLLDRGLNLARACAEPGLAGAALTNFGEVHLGHDDLTAVDYYEQAAKWLHELGDRAAEATARTGLGRAYLNLGQPDPALRCFRKALALRRQTGQLHEEAAALTDIAQAKLGTGDPAGARHALHQALALRRRVPDRYENARIGDILARLGDRSAAATKATAAGRA
jgi:tetratricopeptide (TPR) repeat protein